ncbi:MAG: hypothetical protein ACTSX1_03440 [Candidatus Heimdallarchaeaceae archaeon]
MKKAFIIFLTTLFMFISIQTVNAHDEKRRYKKNQGHYHKHKHTKHHKDHFRNYYDLKNPYYKRYDPPVPYYYFDHGWWNWGHPNMHQRHRGPRHRIRIQVIF